MIVWHVLIVCGLALSLASCTLTSMEDVTPTPQVTLSATNTITPSNIPNPTLEASVTPQNTSNPLVNDFDSAPTLAITAQEGAPVGERDPATSIPLASTNAPTPALTPETIFPDTFPDRYTTSPLNAGRTLLVNYSVTLDNPGVGQVFFVVRDPDDAEVDRWVITESDDGTREIPVEVSGAYTILAAFRNLRGNYSVDFGFR